MALRRRHWEVSRPRNYVLLHEAQRMNLRLKLKAFSSFLHTRDQIRFPRSKIHLCVVPDEFWLETWINRWKDALGNRNIRATPISLLGTTSSTADAIWAHVPVVSSRPVPLQHTPLTDDVIGKLHTEVVESVCVAPQLPAEYFKISLEEHEQNSCIEITLTVRELRGLFPRPSRNLWNKPRTGSFDVQNMTVETSIVGSLLGGTEPKSEDAVVIRSYLNRDRDRLTSRVPSDDCLGSVFPTVFVLPRPRGIPGVSAYSTASAVAVMLSLKSAWFSSDIRRCFLFQMKSDQWYRGKILPRDHHTRARRRCSWEAFGSRISTQMTFLVVRQVCRERQLREWPESRRRGSPQHSQN